MGFQRNIEAMRSITSGESRIERLTTEEFPSFSLNLLGRLQDLPTIYGTSGFANHLAKFRKWGNIISGVQVEYAMGCKCVVNWYKWAGKSAKRLARSPKWASPLT